jgi:tRNA dimethylallyltransferase
MPCKQKTIFCLFGPTAAGKTAAATLLTKEFPLEIISVDSAMVYRGMDIGTAKPTALELQITPHRLINICDPAQSYSVGQFCSDATREIEAIFAQNKLPLLVGGTMLYFKALQYGISALPSADLSIRAELLQQAAQFGLNNLYQELITIDPQTAAILSPADTQRIFRALEVFRISGKTLSELKKLSPPKISPYKFINIGMAPEKLSYLETNINTRFNTMLELGLIVEVEQLYQRQDLNLELPAIRMVGYRQVWQYLAGQISYN